MNKRQKILISLVLIALVLTSTAAVISTQASIAYGFNYDFIYKQDGNNWVTVNWITNTSTNGMFLSVECANSGLMDGTFTITVEFANASFNTTTTQPYTQVGESTVKFPMNLHGHEHKTIGVNFSIENNVTNFQLKVLFESTQFLIQSNENNAHNSNTMDFAKDESGTSFHQINV